MNRLFITPPNAILFVLDPTNKNALVPKYVVGELTAITDSCISVGTQASVDGKVEVSMILSNEEPIDLRLAIHGKIIVPNGKVAVVTSEFEKLIEIDLPIGEISASIWVDDLQSPSKVQICLCQ